TWRFPPTRSDEDGAQCTRASVICLGEFVSLAAPPIRIVRPTTPSFALRKHGGPRWTRTTYLRGNGARALRLNPYLISGPGSAAAVLCGIRPAVRKTKS